MSMRRREVLVGLFGAAFSLISGGAFAADTPLIKCTRVGQSVIYRNQKFTWVKKSGKLIWGKGVPLPVKSPSPTAKASTTPTPSATPTPTPTPSASATPTLTPSASPTPSPSPSPTKKFVKLANSSDIPSGSVKVFEAGRTTGLLISIVLIRDNAGLRALQAECPHAGYIVKDNGGGELICPAHNSLFSAKDGALLRGPASYPLNNYLVTETGGEIFVTI
jgi:nitrite reductase/ring-hydroxylating ferredoxin subunit